MTTSTQDADFQHFKPDAPHGTSKDVEVGHAPVRTTGFGSAYPCPEVAR